MKYFYLFYFSLLPIIVACASTTTRRHNVIENSGVVCLPNNFVEALYYDNATLFYQRNFWREETGRLLNRDESTGVWQVEDDYQLYFEQEFYDVD